MKKIINTLAIIIVLLIIANPFFIVREGQQAIITQFGKPIGKPITSAGLKIRIPIIQKVNYFEKRLLEWDGDPNQIPTKDKKYIWVDTTARWRIADPLKFFQSVYVEKTAQARLDDILDSAVRDAISSHNLISIVRSSNRIINSLQKAQEKQEFIEEGALEKITVGREEIRREILEKANKLSPQYGIEIIDIRIKRINYTEDVRDKVYARMIAERKRVAEQYRSEGRGVHAEIQGKTEKELKAIRSEAYKESQKIRGQAEAKITDIYADAYNQDPEFFFFIKTLESYEATIDENTMLILDTDSDYLRYFKSIFSQPTQ